ncbi:MAG: OmpA family protein [Desulfarculus sp.]|nr:OmpA family protein [Desulfarculus sp.]
MAGKNIVVKKGLPPWMATFSDLCTLLLTFFVLLLTFANMDVQKFREMLGSVQNAFGVQTMVKGEYQAAISPQPAQHPTPGDPGGFRATAPSLTTAPPPGMSEAATEAEAEGMAQQVRELVRSSGMGDMVDVNASSRGVRLRVKGKILFEPGQAQVLDGAKKFLDGIVQVMNRHSFYLTVEGHTDSTPISTAQFPSNWELSAARATAVLRYLVGRGVSENRVSAIGYASNYPLASNSSEDGRNQNRRVEFVFTKKPLRIAVD